MRYLISRHVSLDSINRYNIGYSDDNEFSSLYQRMVFPILGEFGAYLGAQGRAMRGQEPKYWHTPFEKGKHLYGLYECAEDIVSKGFVVVVEGPFDVIAAYQSGVPAVALLGPTMTDRHICMLKKYTDNVILWLDKDEAGSRGMRHALGLLRDRKMKYSTVYDTDNLPEHKDISECYYAGGSVLIRGILGVPC